jgi:hypothetical protein
MPRMFRAAVTLSLTLALACEPAADPAGPGPAGVGGDTATAGAGGSGATVGGAGGAGAGGGGASAGGGGGAGAGGRSGNGAAGGNAGGGRADSGAPPGTDAAGGGGSDAADGPAADAPPAGAPGQGPVAEGQIVFSQDFEDGHAGITFSPTNLPASRGMIVEDPLGQRGKVMRMQWLPGDNYRIGQYRPRANISNTGYYYTTGDRISYAWGYMTDGDYIGATIAQNITGGDPIWMLRGQANGELDIIPGGGKVPYRLQAKRWHDIRVEIYYVGGAAGLVEFFIDGNKVFTKRGGLPIGPRPHWDGGIYLTGFGEMGEGPRTPRTVYISNISVGKK